MHVRSRDGAQDQENAPMSPDLFLVRGWAGVWERDYQSGDSNISPPSLQSLLDPPMVQTPPLTTPTQYRNTNTHRKYIDIIIIT